MTATLSTPLSLQDQHVLVLGLGASGLAMARWCARCGAQVTVADTRAAPPQLEALQQHVPQARFVSGPLDANLLQGDVAAVFKSPGLKPSDIALVLEAASARGISAGGELSLFSRALQDLAASRAYAPRVLAITGTNGKTTVTALTGQLIARAGGSAPMYGCATAV
jgi:UDP-N-acetylmuramoylalanine--D-glutamate ligase